VACGCRPSIAGQESGCALGVPSVACGATVLAPGASAGAGHGKVTALEIRTLNGQAIVQEQEAGYIISEASNGRTISEMDNGYAISEASKSYCVAASERLFLVEV
jgi:hypothetical protein